jgi:hypothetical protein
MPKKDVLVLLSEAYPKFGKFSEPVRAELEKLCQYNQVSSLLISDLLDSRPQFWFFFYFFFFSPRDRFRPI